MRNVKKINVYSKEPCEELEEPFMEFRLVYQGELFSTQPDDLQGVEKEARRKHKHEVRQQLHPQLKRLWEVTPFLKNGTSGGPTVRVTVSELDTIPKYDVPTLSRIHSKFGWNFVPLVTQQLNLLCGLDILFLRPDKPGNLWAGDIDNRIKTLLDCLSVPLAGELYVDKRPVSGETRFFCLLEEDKYISKLSVETDQLLDYSGNPREVKLIITVCIRPADMHIGNLQFA